MRNWTEMTNPVAFDMTLVRGKARRVAETAGETMFPDLLPSPTQCECHPRQPAPDPCGTPDMFADLTEEETT